jgi:hypothetical protein
MCGVVMLCYDVVIIELMCVVVIRELSHYAADALSVQFSFIIVLLCYTFVLRYSVTNTVVKNIVRATTTPYCR